MAAAKKAVAKPKRKTRRGRPTVYDPDWHPKAAYKACLLGTTDEDLAKAFCIATSTLYDWKAKHPEFREAINAGGVEADQKVAESLYARATGYSHPDTHIAVSNGEVIQTPITKHYPPDNTAAIFWLKNRQSGKWRDRQPDENDGQNINIYLGGKDLQI